MYLGLTCERVRLPIVFLIALTSYFSVVQLVGWHYSSCLWSCFLFTCMVMVPWYFSLSNLIVVFFVYTSSADLFHMLRYCVMQVLHVPPTSPLSGYLGPGDVIQSVDNIPIRNAQEWVRVNTLTYNMKLNIVNISQHSGDFRAVNVRKGYCIPSLMMEESKYTVLGNQYACSDDLTAFVEDLCSSATPNDGQDEADLSNRGWNFYCLNAKDVVKLKKCADDWGLATPNRRSGCTCSKVKIYLNVYCISNLCQFSCSHILCTLNMMVSMVKYLLNVLLVDFLRMNFV